MLAMSFPYYRIIQCNYPITVNVNENLSQVLTNI